MKYVDEYRDTELSKKLVARISRLSTREAKFMEFCGGHTVAILKHGIRQLLPPGITMLSGPGCPVCVTAAHDLDTAIAIAGVPDTIVATFGDMMRVPGSESSLAEAKANGADVRVVYSPRDALDTAAENPSRQTVFIAVGFETTSPGVAAAIIEAGQRGLKNFSVKCLLKTCPQVIHALLDSGEVKLEGMICPGHVSAITGSRAWEFIPAEYGIASAVTGFEPLDILFSVERLVAQIEGGAPRLDVTYTRGVKPEGNLQALKLMDRVFEPAAAEWRGLGSVGGSGLRLRKECEQYDADHRMAVEVKPAREPAGCSCGEILRGAKTPPECALFARVCTPERPVGPCMVSSEGACAAHYQFGR